MIFAFIIWAYIYFVSTAWGLFFFSAIKKISPNGYESIPIYIISTTGLALLCSFLSIFSIFYKIDFVANTIILAVSIAIYFLSRNEVLTYFSKFKKAITSINLMAFIFLAIGSLIIILETISEVKIYDTGSYHAQAIQWINEYGIVPGLGNLHQRFAFNNQSFILEALFNFKFLQIQTFHILNGYVSLLFTLTMLYYFLRDLKSKKVSSLFYLFLLAIPLFFYRKYISSASPDILVALITIFIFLVYINFQHNFALVFWTTLMLSCFLITIKVSSIPIVLLPTVYFFTNIKKIKWEVWLLSISIVFLFFIPYFTRNVIISGYVLYPFTKLDLFNFDWKIPKEYVDQMNVIIKGWARTKEWSIDKSFMEWFPLWFSKLTIFNKLSVVISIFGPLLMIISGLFSSYKQKITKEEKVLSLVLLIYTLFWLASAPDLRFIFHIQVYSGALLVVVLVRQINFTHKAQKFIFSYGLPTILALFLIATVSQSFSLSSVKKNFLTQAPYPSPKTISLSRNNVSINSPEDNELCWDTCLPCSIIQDNIGISPLIQQRGPSLASGFKANQK